MIRQFSQAGTLCFAAIASGPVAAEVCDKIMPGRDGVQASWQAYASEFLTEPIGLAAVFLVVVTLLARRRWLAGVSTGLLALALLFIVLRRVLDSGIPRAAFEEGCGGNPWTAGFLVTGMIVITGFRYWRLR